MNVKHLFRTLRFDPSTHLGLGDIRLTVADQEDILYYIDSLEKKLKIEHTDQYLFGSEV